MPAEFRIDLGRRLVFTRGTGILTYDELLQHMVRLGAHPDFRPDFRELNDGRALESVEITTPQLRALAGHTMYNLDARRAYVAKSDLQYGLTRMFGTFRETIGDEGIRIFRTMEEALDWLGLTEADLPDWT